MPSDPHRPARRRWLVPAAVALAVVAGTTVGVLTTRDSSGTGTLAGQQGSAPATTPAPTTQAPSVKPSPSASKPPSKTPTKAKTGEAAVEAKKSTFPGASNTGVPAGVKLKPMTGELVVSKAGAVVDGIDLVGRLVVKANNVTIKRSRITAPKNLPNQGRDEFTVIQQDTSVKGMTMEDCEIDGSGIVYRAIMAYDGLNVSRCEMKNIGHGVEIGTDYVIKDSWIHSTTDGPDDDWHVDGIISSIGDNGLIEHNTIVLSGGSLTGAVSIGSSIGPIDNVIVRNNLLAGGNYCVYIQDQGHPATNIQVVDNWFSTQQEKKVGVYGIWYGSDLPKDLVRRGNKILETGKPADDEPDWG